MPQSYELAYSVEGIKQRIFSLRGKRVILDRDLAELYHVETRVMNQAVKRNISRFPSDFMMQLTIEEWKDISSQFVTTSANKRPLVSLPYAFTEHGVIMLASLLRSDIAITTSVQITRAFVAMREAIYALATTEQKIEILNEKVEKLNLYIENVMHDQNDINEQQAAINDETSMQLELINQSLAELQAKPKEKPRNPIGFR